MHYRDGTGVLAVVLGLILLASQGCVAPEAIRQAQVQATANWAHADDPDLPPEAREIGAVNAAAWEIQRYSLDGTHPSARAIKASEAGR